MKIHREFLELHSEKNEPTDLKKWEKDLNRYLTRVLSDDEVTQEKMLYIISH